MQGTLLHIHSYSGILCLSMALAAVPRCGTHHPPANCRPPPLPKGSFHAAASYAPQALYHLSHIMAIRVAAGEPLRKLGPRTPLISVSFQEKGSSPLPAQSMNDRGLPGPHGAVKARRCCRMPMLLHHRAILLAPAQKPMRLRPRRVFFSWFRCKARCATILERNGPRQPRPLESDY